MDKAIKSLGLDPADIERAKEHAMIQQRFIQGAAQNMEAIAVRLNAIDNGLQQIRETQTRIDAFAQAIIGRLDGLDKRLETALQTLDLQDS